MANDGKICRGFYGIEVTPDYVKAIDHYSAWIEKYAEEHPEYTIRCENEKEWRKTFRQIVRKPLRVAAVFFYAPKRWGYFLSRIPSRTNTLRDAW